MPKPGLRPAISLRSCISSVEAEMDVIAPPAVATDDCWTVAGRSFRSRLIVGTGKYKDFAETAAAIEASGAEMVTVAVRRVNLADPRAPMLQDYVDPKRYTYLPNPD